MSIPTQRDDADEERQDDDEPEGAQRLDVYLKAGEVSDLRLNGRSVWPIWFKIEWKGNGHLSAKVRGVRLSSAAGDEIRIHQA